MQFCSFTSSLNKNTTQENYRKHKNADHYRVQPEAFTRFQKFVNSFKNSNWNRVTASGKPHKNKRINQGAQTFKSFSKSAFGQNFMDIDIKWCTTRAMNYRCSERIGVVRSLYRRMHKHDTCFWWYSTGCGRSEAYTVQTSGGDWFLSGDGYWFL